MLFSSSLREYSQTLPETVKLAIKEIGQYFSITDLKVLSYDAHSIAIPINLKVEIPPNGVVGNVDIRRDEPILIRISLNEFPFVSPLALSDRRDFPRDKLSHIYASTIDVPAALCLVRGNRDEWFSTIRLVDFLAVTEQWYFKAATGRLNKDGNEFDPLRTMDYAGYHIYNYEFIKGVVDDDSSFVVGKPVACMFTLLSNSVDGKNEIVFKTLRNIQFIEIPEVLNLIRTLKANKTVDDKNIPLLSLVVWNTSGKIYDDYNIKSLLNYEQLKKYFLFYEIDIDDILKALKPYNLSQKIFPIIHAIKRPKKMVGFNGDYDFVNLLLNADFDKNGKINEKSEVIILSHVEPFSKSLAEKLTDENRNSKTFFIGAGSLGSKIIMHDARSGKVSIGICDEDTFLQHNKARHVLFDNHVGQNKASALVAELESMFKTDIQRTLKSYPNTIIHVGTQEIEKYDWLVDTTASLNVQNWLTQFETSKNVNISKCELVNYGNLGLLYIEGLNRNPRIDDLVNLAYFRAMENLEIEKWRKSDATRDITTLEIGLGCSSTTTVMSDDTISLHAALFSKLIYNEKDRQNIKENGLLFLSSIETDGISQTSSTFEIIRPFEVYKCNAKSGWQIRFINGLSQRLLSLCKHFSPYETGGILIGISNYKTKTIHVFDIIEEPRDSKSSCTGFTRGVDGLPKLVDLYKEKSGNIIGYVGEWHTHPMDLERLSSTDINTITELTKINDVIPIPTLAIIVTQQKILPFVYE